MTVSIADSYQPISVNSDEQSKYEVYSTLEEETALNSLTFLLLLGSCYILEEV